jgi:diguanylate cyclase (GGDEF)-like protein/PAS domain S-box-containing protein
MEKAKVLIVEDDTVIAHMLSSTIADAGYCVVGIAKGCRDAERIAKETKPHIALVDITLTDNDCDGIDLEAELRLHMQIPVIFITATSDHSIRTRLQNSRCYGFLAKPVNQNELLINIESALKRHSLEKALRASEEKFRLIYEASPIGIELYDDKGELFDANQACLDIFGVSDVNHIRGFKLFEDPNVSSKHKEKLKRGETIRYEAPFDFDLVHAHNLYPTSKSGVIYLDVLITPLHNPDNGIRGYLVQVQDITTRKLYENTLRELSMVDQLTGLYNRRGFLKLAQQQLDLAKRNHQKLILFFIDLNNMKKINDRFGHSEGDKALILAAGVLRKSFRGTDVIARWGGDEFAVLMINASGNCEEKIGARLKEALQAANEEGLLQTELGLSWGCAASDAEHMDNIETLVSRADKAMYNQKHHRE